MERMGERIMRVNKGKLRGREKAGGSDSDCAEIMSRIFHRGTYLDAIPCVSCMRLPSILCDTPESDAGGWYLALTTQERRLWASGMRS